MYLVLLHMELAMHGKGLEPVHMMVLVLVLQFSKELDIVSHGKRKKNDQFNLPE